MTKDFNKRFQFGIQPKENLVLKYEQNGIKDAQKQLRKIVILKFWPKSDMTVEKKCLQSEPSIRRGSNFL